MSPVVCCFLSVEDPLWLIHSPKTLRGKSLTVKWMKGRRLIIISDTQYIRYSLTPVGAGSVWWIGLWQLESYFHTYGLYDNVVIPDVTAETWEQGGKMIDEDFLFSSTRNFDERYLRRVILYSWILNKSHGKNKTNSLWFPVGDTLFQLKIEIFKAALVNISM